MDTFDRYNYLTSLETSDINVVRDMLDTSNSLLSQQPPNSRAVQELTGQSSTAKPTWPSGVQVEKFTARLIQVDSMAELVPQRNINNAMSLLLPRMPNLESCSFEGLFYTSTLREVVRTPTLHTLDLQTNKDHLCLCNGPIPWYMKDYYQKSQHVGFRSMIVDSNLLTQLPDLRKLVVWRFVSLPRVEHLEIEIARWSYRWGYEGHPNPELDFTSDDPSPLSVCIQ